MPTIEHTCGPRYDSVASTRDLTTRLKLRECDSTAVDAHRSMAAHEVAERPQLQRGADGDDHGVGFDAVTGVGVGVERTLGIPRRQHERTGLVPQLRVPQ